MRLEDHSWRYWPPAREKAAEVSVVSSVVAEPAPLDLPFLVDRIAHVLPEWVDEQPPGIEKVAGLREDGEELPQVTPTNIWRHPQAHPLALALLLLDRYGEAYVEWLPETLKSTLERDGLQLSNSSWVKILATRVLLYSPSPWRQWEVFHWTALGLAGQQPNFTFLEEPELGHLVVAADLMRVVDPKRAMGEEVDKFVAATLRSEGIPFAPSPLDFCQRELEARKIECASCHALHRDDNDVRCVTCGSTQLTKVPYEFAELRDGCSKEWKALSRLSFEQALSRLSEETQLGSVLSTLLMHWDYAKQVRSQMAQQFRMIGRRP